MEKPKPVGIWIRVSTEDQARGESPEHHEKRARGYAEAKGWEVKEVYHLLAISGKSVMDRPETKKMLEDVRKGHIKALIFSKLARLARNTKELLEISDIFNEYKADLISLQESIDTSTPVGRVFYTLIAAMAQWEREEISERVKASIPIRIELGKPVGGKAIYGYQWVDNKLVPHSQEAPVRRLIYELFLEHRRKKRVAKIINERGYRTRDGKLFTGDNIRRLLRDPTAKGLRRANYTTTNDKGNRILKPKDEWIYTKVEPIVSDEIWNQCNHILDSQKIKVKKPSRKAVHLFSGFAYCHCGNKMYVPSNSPKYTCYKCRNKIPTKDLEEIYHKQLENYILSPDVISDQLDQLDQNIKEKNEQLNALLEEEKKIHREMDKLYKAYIDDDITSKTYGARNQPLEERLLQIEDQIPELQADIDFQKIRYLSSDQILNEARSLYSQWQHFTTEAKRQLIEQITEKIVIGTDEIEITLSYIQSPPFSKEMTKGVANLDACPTNFMSQICVVSSNLPVAELRSHHLIRSAYFFSK